MRTILLSRWLLSGIAVALLAALVWVFGPFLSVLEGVLPRAGVIVLLVVIWAAVNWWIGHRRRARDAALAAGVAEADPATSASAEESDALRERLATAMELLRRARGTRGWLYEQPWYAIIGPPGAGKTTALLNSGLRFPLAAEMGEGAVAGVGGTRLCDWWFTDDAVLIDTAGRYTTQDSDAAVDRAGWEAFLQLLKRTRPRQPLNGVIVAIAPGRHRAGDARGAHGPRRRHPPPAEGAAREARRAPAGLCAVHQGRPDRRLHRVLRRPGSRAPRPGLGRDLRAEAVRGGSAGRLRRRLRQADRAAGRPPAGPHAGRAQPGPPRADRRLPRPGGQPGRAAARLPGSRLFRFPPGPGAAAARRLPLLRHAGRHADRPADRAPLRAASASTSAARRRCGRSTDAATSCPA